MTVSARDLPLDEALANFLVHAGGDDPLHPDAALEAARTFIEYHGLIRSSPAAEIRADGQPVLPRLTDALGVTTDYLLGRPQPVTDAVDEYVGALRAEVARLLSDADDAIAHGFFDAEEEEAYMHGRAEALAAVRALFEDADDE